LGGGLTKLSNFLYQWVSEFANIVMAYLIEYFHPKVLKQIESWQPDMLASYTRLLDVLMVHGPALRLPYSRAMGEGLFEIRPSGKSSIGRCLYCFQKGQRIIVLHAFIKKTPKTPDADLSIARKRMKEIQYA